jgi:hypothetical protein
MVLFDLHQYVELEANQQHQDLAEEVDYYDSLLILMDKDV